MNTPSIFSLNVRDLQWLQAEEKAWMVKQAQALTAQDKKDAQSYLDAVRAELAQRTEQMGTLSGRIFWLTGGIAESLGGSGGAGAQGLSASVAQTVGDAATAAKDTARNVLMVVGLLALAFLAYQIKKK